MLINTSLPHHQIQLAVAIQIPRRDGHRNSAYAETDRLERKGTVPGSQKNGDIVGQPVRHSQIGDSVAVKVADRECRRSRVNGIRHRSPERAIAIPERHAHQPRLIRPAKSPTPSAARSPRRHASHKALGAGGIDGRVRVLR